MTNLNKLCQTYMLVVLNTKELHSKQKCGKHNNVPQYKIGDLVMIKKFEKILTWETKYVANFRIVRLIGTRQLEVSDLTGRLRRVNVSDIHKILPADFIVSCIPDEQVFARKGKYINDPHICYWVVELCKNVNVPLLILTCKMPSDTPNNFTGHTDLLLSGESSIP